MNSYRQACIFPCVLFSLALFVAASVNVESKDSGSTMTEGIRNQILDTLARYPDDPALHQEGKRLLEALDTWDAQLRSSQLSDGGAALGHHQVSVAESTEASDASSYSSAPLPTPLAGLDP